MTATLRFSNINKKINKNHYAIFIKKKFIPGNPSIPDSKVHITLVDRGKKFFI